MKDYVLFIHGTYRASHLPFYRKLCRGKVKVAVDGGHRFFVKAKLKPDILIGDMDSVSRHGQLPAKTIVIPFPVRKDKTDTQLAVEYCMDQGAKSIDIVQPSVGQPDHFVANLLLALLPEVTAWARKGGKLRIVSPAHEIYFMADNKISFSKGKGDTVSVMPLSGWITLTCRGTDYEVAGARISKGHTRGLRNRIVSGRASFAIKGEALLWHFFGK